MQLSRFALYVLLPILGLGTVVYATSTSSASSAAKTLPDPEIDMPLAKSGKLQTAVLAGGCFWGVEGVFEHVKGVTRVESGYAGGTARDANYSKVSEGKTSHAESVRITYDPEQISFGQLLKVYFSVAHDPTQLNYQGPDHGPQYRSAIFYGTPEQKRVADAYINQLQATQAFQQPIVTQITPLKAFYDAEAYHQDFLARHPSHSYIVAHDLPKVANLKRQFPALFIEK